MLVPAWLLLISAMIAVMALAMTLLNLSLYRRSDRSVREPTDPPRIDVCIPARNEAENIEACVRSVLANDYSNLVVRVYDDQSTDATGEILRRHAAEDSRVVLVPSLALEKGWVGKQWACWQMAQHALADARAMDRLLFIDADVRLAGDCLRRTLGEAERLGERGAALLSTFPRQITGSLGERVFVPLIHFILFSYLPFPRMRTTNDPAASAACGQFIFVRADAYLATGGHSQCRDSMHEGVKLPRVLRKAGFHTDLFDGSDLCECRMYRDWASTWRGFAKNAYEGLGSIWLLIFCTLMHLVGHALPALWLVLWAIDAVTDSASGGSRLALASAVLAVAAGLVQRAVLSVRFRQGFVPVVLHPLSLVLLTVLQWHSLVLAKRGKREWRGRGLPRSSGAGLGAGTEEAVTTHA